MSFNARHGTTVNAGPDYAAWANGVQAATSRQHLHNITTHTCEIDLYEAHPESYVLVTMLTPDASTATVRCGRYIDRLERRDCTWRIALRRSTVELATPLMHGSASSFFTSQSYPHGRRDHGDASYARPLTLD